MSETGEVAERLKAAVSKTVIPFGYLGFESLPLRQISSGLVALRIHDWIGVENSTSRHFHSYCLLFL